MIITPEKLIEWGRKAKKTAPQFDPLLAHWETFSNTFGFYQWKKKLKLTEEDIEHFKRGWDEA